MHVTLVIVICIVILGMVVEASINSRVHAEYIRRRHARGQSIFNELPAGVHAEYIRRRRHAPEQHYVKILQEIIVRKYRRQPTSRVRPHIRQQQRSGGNIHI